MMTGTIVAMGGGGFSMEPDNSLLDDFVLSLAPQVKRPKVCFVPTASGDSEGYIERFTKAFPKQRADASVLSLFRRDVSDLRSFVLAQDILYVGGGNTANLLAVWRLHGLDEVIREALAAGIVCAGLSAGMNCWFQGSVTDSFAPALKPLTDGLGLLEGSACPHYDGEKERRPTYKGLVATGDLPAGYAADDGCALLFSDGVLSGAFSSRPRAGAFRVSASPESSVREEPIPVTYLGS